MKLFKHPIRETINNYMLRLKAFELYKQKPQEYREAARPEGYKRVFHDDFKSHLRFTDKWRFGMPWGDFHTGHLYQHFDNGGHEAYTTKDAGLVLETKHRPLHIIKSKLATWRQSSNLPEEFTIPYAVGLVSTKDSWHYGWFEANIKLPKGSSLWPAFWLSGAKSWPPEIDILEAYSKYGPEYNDRFLFKKRPHVRIQPNLHYGVVEEGTKEMYGSYNVPVYDATNRYVHYACWGEKDFIRIYYDGNLVFECMDPDVLQHFNKSTHDQFIILNNGTQETGYVPDESVMHVRSVSVYQKK